jgi:hypothetical protein
MRMKSTAFYRLLARTMDLPSHDPVGFLIRNDITMDLEYGNKCEMLLQPSP